MTARETPENLDRIATVLAERDIARPDVQLLFQLIEADGFTETDPRIAAVTDQLRSIFQFSGYRLAGEAMLSVTDGSEMQQQLRGSDGVYQIVGEVSWVGPGTLRLEDVELWDGSLPVLKTTVNVRPGQTLFLGSSPHTGPTATLLLTVRAEEVP